MTRARISWISLAVCLLVIGVGIVIAAAPQQKASMPAAADTLMGAGLHQEEVEGNLDAAIATYKKVIADARATRSLKATALLHLGRSYEKLGDAEAWKAYERLVREFADQGESAATARTRLAALTRPGDGTTGLVARLVWGDASLEFGGAISPDGRYLVYVGPEIALHVRDLSTGLNRRLTVPVAAGDTARPNGDHVFSPDGRLIASGWWDRAGTGRTDMRFVRLDGSAPPVFHQSKEWTALSPDDWSADGKQILAISKKAGSNNTHILLVSVADGSIQDLKTLGTSYHHPQMMSLSRDGRYIAYDYPARGNAGQRDIFILSTQGGQEARLVARAADDGNPAFTPDGTGVLFLSGGAAGESKGAWYQRVVDGKPLGSPELLRPDVGRNPIPIGFTPNGSFYYYRDESASSLFVATLDQTNGALPVQADTVTQRVVTSGPSWSPDGQYLAYGSERPSAQGAADVAIIVIRALATGEERELTPALGHFRIRTSGWSPDGRALLASGTDTSGRTGLYRVDARSGDIARLLDEIPTHFSWFLNGKALVFIRWEGDSDDGSIVLHDLETGRETELYRPSAPIVLGSCVEVSGDGQRLAFYIQDPVTRTNAVMVMTAPGGKPREIGPRVKYPEVIDDIWALAPDGQRVLFTTYDAESVEQVHRAWQIAVDGGAPQGIRLPMAKLDYVGAVSVHPDGKRIAFDSSGPRKQSVRVLENFLPKGIAR